MLTLSERAFRRVTLYYLPKYIYHNSYLSYNFQIQLMQEMVGTARRMGNHAIATRYGNTGCGVFKGGIQKCFKFCAPGPRPPAHTVADRQILFKKSLMVFKHPYGSPEVPYTLESHNPLLKIFQFIR